MEKDHYVMCEIFVGVQFFTSQISNEKKNGSNDESCRNFNFSDIPFDESQSMIMKINQFDFQLLPNNLFVKLQLFTKE
jgi:hypothetical protein